MKRQFSNLSLGELILKSAENLDAADQGKEVPRFQLPSRLLEAVDAVVPDRVKICRHALEYQYLVAGVVSSVSERVATAIGDMDEDTFAKLCRRSGREFPEKSPSEWREFTPLEGIEIQEIFGAEPDFLKKFLFSFSTVPLDS